MEKYLSELRPHRPGVFLAWFQGLYYVIAGIWPVFSIGSFMAVTGPKTDIWLVRTVGLLLVAVGAALCLAAHRRTFIVEVIVLAAGSALALTLIELVYVLNGTISQIYLLDALVEILLIGGWVWLWFARRERAGEEPPRRLP